MNKQFMYRLLLQLFSLQRKWKHAQGTALSYNNFGVILSLSACFCFSTLQAEIQKVVITWTPGLCQDTCIRSLDHELRKVPGVADIAMNQLGARADIQWKPNFNFSFKAIEAAMAMIGLSINDLRVKVRGSLTHDDLVVWLVSTGDGTRLMLLSPIETRPLQYTEFYNIEAHRLAPEMRDRLLEAEYNNATVTIEGSLFSPERSPPLAMVIEKLQIDKPQPELR